MSVPSGMGLPMTVSSFLPDLVGRCQQCFHLLIYYVSSSSYASKLYFTIILIQRLMYTDRKSRSPTTRLIKPTTPPRTHSRKSTSPALSPSFHRSPQPSPAPRKAPPSISAMFQEVCCPNCRYVFKIIKEQIQELAKVKVEKEPQATQTPMVFTHDISTITKEIENIMLSPRGGRIEVPKLGLEASRKTVVAGSPIKSLVSSPIKRNRQELPTATILTPTQNTSFEFRTKDVTDMYTRFHEKDVILGEVSGWLRRQQVTAPAYIKCLLET